MLLFEYISFFLLVFTSLVGIFSIVRIITEWIYDDNTDLHTISILPLKPNEERVEMLLRSFFSKNEGNVIILDLGIDEKTIEIIKHIKGKRENVAIVKNDELKSYLDNNISSLKFNE